MIWTIKSRLGRSFCQWFNGGWLHRRHDRFRRELRRKWLVILGRLFMLLRVYVCGWKTAKGALFFLSPVLTDLSTILFVAMLRINSLWLQRHLLLVLRMNRLVVVRLWLRIGNLEGTCLGGCRNALLENSRKNILVLLLLWESLWDITGQVVLLIEIPRLI